MLLRKKQYKYDIAAIGEALIDFVPSPYNDNEEDSLTFKGNPGGAPANVLASSSKLGSRTAFIGKVGNDVFGDLLIRTLSQAGICVTSMIITDEHPTTLAFVSLDKKGDRSFSFYRNQTADCMLVSTEIDRNVLASSRIFHFGSVSMTTEPSRTATLDAVKLSKQLGAVISFDPNLRPLLWSCLDEAKRVILSAFEYSDIVKLSEDELLFLTEISDLKQAMENLYNKYCFKTLVVTLGAKGSVAVNRSGIYTDNGFSVQTKDTTGAGDAFWGAFLYYLTDHKILEVVDRTDLTDALKFADASGALSTTEYGAIPSFASLEKIHSLYAI